MSLIYKSQFFKTGTTFINQNLDLYKFHRGFLSWLFSITYQSCDNTIIKHNHAHSTSWRIVNIRHSLASWSINPLIDVQDIVDGVYSTLNEDIWSCRALLWGYYENIDHVWSCKERMPCTTCCTCMSHPIH